MSIPAARTQRSPSRGAPEQRRRRELGEALGEPGGCTLRARARSPAHLVQDMKYSGALVALLCLAGLAMLKDHRAHGMPPAQCSPNLLDEVPPRIRKVCAALSTIYELGSAMENYINEKVPMLRSEGIPLPDSGVKRQDVDHVFLRFGRRRR